MVKDRDQIRSLYENIIEEQLTPLAVQQSAKGDGETGGLKPDDLPADAASTTELQKGRGAEAADTKAPEEAEEKLSPVNKNKGTDKVAKKKQVTTIKDSVEPTKSFMDLFDQVMVKEEGEDIESPAYNDDQGDFPETENEAPVEGEMDEGAIYSQLADLFSQLASIKGDELGGEMGAEGEMEEPVPSAESVDEDGNPIEEMKSEPEPKELNADIKQRQLPTKLAGKGVTKGSSKKAASKGSDKKRTGELEDGPEGMKHDKSKFAVDGDGPIHKAKNASFLES